MEWYHNVTRLDHDILSSMGAYTITNEMTITSACHHILNKKHVTFTYDIMCQQIAALSHSLLYASSGASCFIICMMLYNLRLTHHTKMQQQITSCLCIFVLWVSTLVFFLLKKCLFFTGCYHLVEPQVWAAIF